MHRRRRAAASTPEHDLDTSSESARHHPYRGMSTHTSGVTSNEDRAARAHGYEGTRPEVQAHVPLGARNILELGCSTGALGAALKARQETRVTGVELSEQYADEAASRIDRVIVADVERFSAGEWPAEAPFDCLVAADVLEHLVDPWAVLARCVAMLGRGAKVVVSLPNVLYWPELRRVVGNRQWPHTNEGIFDRTHLRWFTLRDGVELLRGAGLRDVQVEPAFWSEGWRQSRDRALWRTPLRDFVSAQHILVARVAGAA